MAVSGSTDSYGEVGLLVSPPHRLPRPTKITIRISTKMRHEDPYPSLQLLLPGLSAQRRLTLDQTSIGFYEQSVCVPAGETTLVFVATWGMFSSPYIAIDNVTVTDQTCDPDVGQYTKPRGANL